MSIKQFTALVRSEQERIKSNHSKVALLAALDAAALMKRRVINERIDADGGIFGLYSENYQKRRKRRNLLGSAVNFSFSNKMWNSTTARILSDTGYVVTILISPDPENIFKMASNTERFGTILELNKDEIDLHAQIYESKLKTI
jgi:hypothetical protein